MSTENGQVIIIALTFGLIRKIQYLYILHKDASIFKQFEPSRRNVKIELDPTNYATKSNLKETTSVDTSNLATNSDLTTIMFKNILRLFNGLANFSFTTSEINCNYY